MGPEMKQRSRTEDAMFQNKLEIKSTEVILPARSAESLSLVPVGVREELQSLSTLCHCS